MYKELITYNLLLFNKCFTLHSQNQTAMSEKQCTRCGHTKPIEQFVYRKKSRGDGYSYRNVCKECELLRRNAFRHNHPPSDITHKICKICGNDLPIDNFALSKERADGYESRCRNCERERMAKFRAQNPGYYDKYNKKKTPLVKVCVNCGKEYETRYPTQKVCSRECKPMTEIRKLKLYLAAHPEIDRKAYIKARHAEWQKTKYKGRYNDGRYTEKARERKKAYIAANREVYNKARYQYTKRRMEKDPEYRAKRIEYKRNRKNYRINTDPNYKLTVKLRTKLYLAIRNHCKYTSAIKLLGCDINEARQHIENQFQPGMTWDNWGQFGWHIDHIMPIASFDLSILSEQQKCFHYTNLQPLWWRDNLAKRDKIYEEQYAEIQ
jgi:hypothetical protein